jgi:hypothetical protein
MFHTFCMMYYSKDFNFEELSIEDRAFLASFYPTHFCDPASGSCYVKLRRVQRIFDELMYGIAPTKYY